MGAFKYDGDHTAEAAVAKPTFANPFPEVNAAYILTQPFERFLANYAVTALNTAHPDYADFKLAEESPRVPLGQGIVTWEKTYAKLPADFDQFETTNYRFLSLIHI